MGADLAYALVQALHNLGAALVLGVVLIAWWIGSSNSPASLAWLGLAAWSAQAATGTGLGAVSLYFKGRFPELSVIATTALGIKIIAAILGFVLFVFLLRARWTPQRRARAWIAEGGLGAIALIAAAFLRWFA
jgi:hypothetical protein